MKNDFFPIVLGGAQLGMKYGIANQQGKPSEEEAFQLLEAAERAGVTYVDTAKAYGESESVVASYLKKFKSNLKIISKFHSENDDFLLALEERKFLFGEHLAGILFHDPGSLKNAELSRKIKEAKVPFGVSIYSEQEFMEAINTDWVSIIQAPFNVWDWSLVRKELIKEAQKRNKLVMLRSLLLQGALTLSPDVLASRVPDARPFSIEWDQLCQKMSKEKMQAALEFAFSAAPSCGFVIGCDDLNQFLTNLRIYQRKDDQIFQLISAENLFQNVPDSVTKPYLWKK